MYLNVLCKIRYISSNRDCNVRLSFFVPQQNINASGNIVHSRNTPRINFETELTDNNAGQQ